jgi:hypothetical protein
MPAVKPIGGLIPLNQYAAKFGINITTARRNAAKGTIPGVVKIGCRYFIPQQVIDAIEAGAPLHTLIGE